MSNKTAEAFLHAKSNLNSALSKFKECAERDVRDMLEELDEELYETFPEYEVIER